MLSFIPTPIGNKEDITLRALRLLRELTIFFCEDTRTIKNLFRMYDIPYQDKKFHALTSFSNESTLAYYASCMKEQDCGVVSEAGTPGLSDPGKSLIKLVREHKIPFEVLPGANALIPAVVASPFDTSSFEFVGFLPAKKGRKTLFEKIKAGKQAVFGYESVHRIDKMLAELQQIEYKGQIVIHRELSKMFEQKERGSCEELQEKVKSGKIPLKGEFVVGFYPG